MIIRDLLVSAIAKAQRAFVRAGVRDKELAVLKAVASEEPYDGLARIRVDTLQNIRLVQLHPDGRTVLPVQDPLSLLADLRLLLVELAAEACDSRTCFFADLLGSIWQSYLKARRS